MRAEVPSASAGPADLARIKQQIAADLGPYDVMQVLACLVATSGVFTRKAIYSELNDDSAGPIEYATSILLERTSREPIGKPGTPAEMSAAIQRTLDRVRGLSLQRVVAGRQREEEASTPLDAISAAVDMHDAISRWPGYADQARALLVDLDVDAQVAQLLRATLGFDVEQALRLDAAVGSLLTRRFNEHGERTADVVNDREERLEADAGGVVAELRASSTEERARRGRWLLAQEFFSERLRDALLITAADLAAEARLELSVAEAFLSAFAVSFGDTKGTTILTGRNIVRKRPFVADGEGSFLLTFPGNLLWEIRPLVEGVIKSDQALLHTYEATRSSYAERQTADQLRRALKTDDVWTNLWYSLDGVRYEADVLACVDDVCVVVEVKAGTLSERASRGRRTELRRDLQALLGKGSAQCGRLADEIQAGRAPAFVDRDTRTPIEIDLGRVQRVEAVVVTLEPLGFTGLAFPHLRAAGLLGSGEPPWVVSLFDLAAIVASVAYTPQFTSYVRRRRELDERVEFLDECDLWMLHLRDTLDMSLVSGRSLLVDGRSDDLNRAWIFGERQPTMKLDKASKRRLRELDRKRPPGFIAFGETVIEQVQQCRRPRVRSFGDDS